MKLVVILLLVIIVVHGQDVGIKVDANPQIELTGVNNNDDKEIGSNNGVMTTDINIIKTDNEVPVITNEGTVKNNEDNKEPTENGYACFVDDDGEDICVTITSNPVVEEEKIPETITEIEVTIATTEETTTKFEEPTTTIEETTTKFETEKATTMIEETTLKLEPTTTKSSVTEKNNENTNVCVCVCNNTCTNDNGKDDSSKKKDENDEQDKTTVMTEIPVDTTPMVSRLDSIYNEAYERVKKRAMNNRCGCLYYKFTFVNVLTDVFFGILTEEYLRTKLQPTCEDILLEQKECIQRTRMSAFSRYHCHSSSSYSSCAMKDIGLYNKFRYNM